MAYSATIFNQLLAMIPREQFQSVVTKYRGDYRVHTFSCWSQLVVMIYAQLTDKDSLRDLETALLSKKILVSSRCLSCAAFYNCACERKAKLANLS